MTSLTTFLIALGPAARSELGVGGEDTGREASEQLMGDGVLPVQVQAGPVVGEHPGGRLAP